jgi:tRNA threonylcarbamoyladenosine biosynthesis protein TsaB
MAVLVMDTSGPVSGVALATEARVWMREGRVGPQVDAVVLVWAQELMAEAGLSLADLQGVGVASGPGAFTGLRAGLSSVAGVAFARSLPLWSGDGLESRAMRAWVAGGPPVLAMLDARKGRVYAAAWGSGGERLWGPEDVEPADVLARMPAGFVATGEGAVVFAALVAEHGGVLASEPDAAAVEVLARLCLAGLARGEGGAAVDARPMYLREPDVRLPQR